MDAAGIGAVSFGLSMLAIEALVFFGGVYFAVRLAVRHELRARGKI